MRKLIVPALICSMVAIAQNSTAGPFQANGIKIGEVDQTGAVIWTRLTTVETGNYELVAGAAPGMIGEARVEYWPQHAPASSMSTSWQTADAAADYTRQFILEGLIPNTPYALRVEARPAGGGAVSSTIEGSFGTAPEAEQIVPVLFTAVTGQGLGTTDSGTNGHRAYQQMLDLNPDFFVHTGDVLYYDKNFGELSQSYTQANERWNRMFSLGYNLDFHRQVASYFIKDDHDTLKDDCVPGQVYGSLTFDQGVEIFHHQTPSGPVRYRTFRWGKDLQIWLTENREFRDPNGAPDGPDKSIWGETQKAWFTNTVAASDATFKLLVSPGAVIGPDKSYKQDNHANSAWQTEGDEIRQFIAGQGNMYIVCGDRHWQYASIDPVTQAREYCTGAINEEHAGLGGGPGYDMEKHSYYAVRGGFLSIQVEREAGQPQITFRWHDVDDLDPQTGEATMVHEETLRPYDFGLVTLTRDHIEDDVAIQFMSRMGYQYRVESSTNLIDWVVATNGMQARGSLIEFNDTGVLAQHDNRFYRVVETVPGTGPQNGIAPFAIGSNGSQVSNSTVYGNEFNRADFVLDLQFTTPENLGANSDFMLFEAGGSGRGMIIALQGGKLGITGGSTGSSIVNYLGGTALLPSTAYSLRVNAVAEAAAGSDLFTADLWQAGLSGPSNLMNETGLTVDGFSGSAGAGVGVVFEDSFTAGLSLPTAAAPGDMVIMMRAYDPEDVTAEIPMPDQPMP